MKRKTFAVIGLGYMGEALARTLADADCDVMVVDEDQEKINGIADKVVYAVRADVTEEDVLKSLDIQDVDVAIIAISENMTASITATMQVLELNVPYVVAKAANELHGRILRRLGVNEVILPERDMGVFLARNLIDTGFAGAMELAPGFSLIEFTIPDHWVGQSLVQLDVRKKYHMTVIGVKKDDQVTMHVHPHEPLPEKCGVIAVGKTEELDADTVFLRE